MARILTRLYGGRMDRKGLGDAVMFNVVLKHMLHYHPDWELFVETTAGKTGCHKHLAKTFDVDDGINVRDFDQVFNFRFADPSPHTCNIALNYNLPPNISLECVLSEIKVEPIKELFRYEILIEEYFHKKAKKILGTLPSKNGIVTIHHQARSNPHKKNISDDDLSKICNYLISNGYTPLILNWWNSSIANDRDIFCLGKGHDLWHGRDYGSAEAIAAVIANSKLFIGVDSGPLHIAGGLNTPTIGFWRQHHPIHCFDFADNVTHVLPFDSRRYIKGGDKKKIEDYFINNFNHKFYGGNHADAIISEIERIFSIPQINTLSVNPRIHMPVLPIQKGQWMSIKLTDGSIKRS